MVLRVILSSVLKNFGCISKFLHYLHTRGNNSLILLFSDGVDMSPSPHVGK